MKSIKRKQIKNGKKIKLYVSGLYGLFCSRLYKLEQDKKLAGKDRFIPVADVRKRMCSTFSAPEGVVVDTLAFLKDIGLIERCHLGIKLNFIVPENV